MRIAVLNKIVGSFNLFLLLTLVPAHAVAASPDLVKAKQEAEAKGHIFFTTHDEIVALAKKEGRLSIMTTMEPLNLKHLVNAFKQEYPFITDFHVEETQGADTYQRFLLEMKSGKAGEWDITDIPIDFAKEYMPYLMKHDILGMAKQRVLKIDPRMIHPGERNIVSVTSIMLVTPYNRKLISEDKVPDKWEDFLKPEFKGRKFAMDLRPTLLATLVPAWGQERTLEFARKLAAQEPVWGSGTRRMTLAILGGEYPLNASATFSTTQRAMSKDPTRSLSYKIVEPVPTLIVWYPSGILNTAAHPHAALLWLEFLASPEGQAIIDKYEPLKASVFTPSSAVAQEVRGKKLSILDWDHFTKSQDYMVKIFAALGFPKADK